MIYLSVIAEIMLDPEFEAAAEYDIVLAAERKRCCGHTSQACGISLVVTTEQGLFFFSPNQIV